MTVASFASRYRTLSLKFHPARNKTPGSAEKSSEIAEAYEVLSNGKFYSVLPDIKCIFFVSTAALRAVYDKFGEEALKCGVPSGDGGKNTLLQG